MTQQEKQLASEMRKSGKSVSEIAKELMFYLLQCTGKTQIF